jgi:hypothetical protein
MRSVSALALKTVQLSASGPSMKRKVRGQGVVGQVWRCPYCNWRSEPCVTMAQLRKAPAHQCDLVPGAQLALEARGRVACR